MKDQELNARKMTNILNMNHVLSGGYNTLYSLSLISELLDVGNLSLFDYVDGIVDVLYEISKINWQDKNQKQWNISGKINDEIGMTIYEIATKLVKISQKSRRIKIEKVISNFENNNHELKGAFLSEEYYEALKLSKMADKFASIVKNKKNR